MLMCWKWSAHLQTEGELDAFNGSGFEIATLKNLIEGNESNRRFLPALVTFLVLLEDSFGCGSLEGLQQQQEEE